MRVRVRVRSRASSRSAELVVLANGGAESAKPCIVVDESTAEKLGLWPPSKWEVVQVEEASSISEAFVIDEAVELELLGDRGETLSQIKADLVVQRGLVEPLITDVTIDELGIVIMSFGRGLWRHASDPPEVLRKSARSR